MPTMLEVDDDSTSNPGQTITVNCTSSEMFQFLDFQKHLLDDASDAGKDVSEEDYNAIVEDKIDVSFVASGIIILPVQ